jgi:hypothetical protein
MANHRAGLLIAGIALALPASALVASPAAAAPPATPAASTVTVEPSPSAAAQWIPGVNSPEAPSGATIRAAAARASVASVAGVRPAAAPLRHPNGSSFYPNVIRWANTVQAVMKELGIPARYLPGILAQIQQESSGRPNAVNRTDSNARRGYASMGLLQVIAPTYRTYAKPGFKGTLIWINVGSRYGAQQFSSPWMTSPYTNIYAALNYVIKTYGMVKFSYWNQGRNTAY